MCSGSEWTQEWTQEWTRGSEHKGISTGSIKKKLDMNDISRWNRQGVAWIGWMSKWFLESSIQLLNSAPLSLFNSWIVAHFQSFKNSWIAWMPTCLGIRTHHPPESGHKPTMWRRHIHKIASLELTAWALICPKLEPSNFCSPYDPPKDRINVQAWQWTVTEWPRSARFSRTPTGFLNRFLNRFSNRFSELVFMMWIDI